MRVFRSVLFLALFLIGLTLLAVFSPAQATSGFYALWKHIAGPERVAFTNDPHMIDSQWRMEEWDASRWGHDRAGDFAVVERFYESGLVTDQYSSRKGLVLEVSDLFLRLSDGDKRKVAMSVDAAYGATVQGGPGGFFIKHERTGSLVGAYTVHGLQLR